MNILLITTNNYIENLISVMYGNNNIEVICIKETDSFNEINNCISNCLGVILALHKDEWTRWSLYNQLINRMELSIPVVFFEYKGYKMEDIIDIEKVALNFLKPFAEIWNGIGIMKNNEQNLTLLAPNVAWDSERNYILKGTDRYLLSDKEQKILSILTKKIGKIVSPQEILTYTEIIELSSLYVHINNIRKKIETNPKEPSVLITKRRQGYVIYQNI